MWRQPQGNVSSLSACSVYFATLEVFLTCPSARCENKAYCLLQFVFTSPDKACSESLVQESVM